MARRGELRYLVGMRPRSITSTLQAEATLDAELADRLFDAWTPQAVMSFLGPVAVALALRTPSNAPVLTWWLLVSLLIGAAGLALAFARRRRRQAPHARFTRAATVISLANGLAVGALIPLPLAPGGATGALLPSIVCAVAGSATLALHAHRPAMLALIGGCVLPTLLWLPFSGLPSWHGGFALLVIFAAMLVGYGLRAHRSLRELLVLRMENRRMLVETERRRHAAEHAERAKTRFLTAASHDLRQPLHALALEVDALDACPPGALPELVARISRSTRALTALADGLLDVSRLDVGAVRVERREVDLPRLLRDLADEYRSRAQRAGLEMHVRAPAAATVATDPLLLQRMLRNLLENALRFTARGGILLAARVRREGLRVDVFDTGVGIAPEHAGRVFEEFYRVAAGAGGSGLGLGLALVRRMADLLHAELRLRSRPGRGSCFSIVLPLAPIAGSTGVGGGGQRGALRVLLLDADPESRATLRALLALAGLDALAVDDLGAALRSMVEAPRAPDVLLVRAERAHAASAIAATERLRDEFNQQIPAALLCPRADDDVARQAAASRIAVWTDVGDPRALRQRVEELSCIRAEPPDAVQ